MVITISTEIIGGIGTFLIILAYFPQIRHIVKEHCAGGVSKNAWLLWLAASLLLLIHAINIRDRVFISLQVVNVIAVSITLILIQIYAPRVCHSKEKILKRK